MMEATLWAILHLAFVLPVAKCISLHCNMREEDCVFAGIFWPLLLIGMILFPMCMLIEFICKSLLNLIKD